MTMQEETTRDAWADEEPLDGSAGGADGGESLEELRAQRDEFLASWQRAQADYKNLRRRSQAELEAGVRRALQPLLEDLLLVLDHLDLALSSPAESEDARNLAAGVGLVRAQLVSALERAEVREVDASVAFDPERHQAVATVPTAEAEPGTVVDVVRKGYLWRDAVLRPAQVRVAAPPTEGSGEAS